MAKKKKTRKSNLVYEVNGDWVDIDLDDETLIPVDDDGHQLGQGLVEEDWNVGRASFVCEDLENFGRYMIPEDKRRDLSEALEQKIRELVYMIMNQGREGSCVGFSTTQACQIRSEWQFGPKYRCPLSGISLYNRIGRSPQSGAMMSDGARESSEDGILPLDTPEARKLFKHVYRATGWVNERRMNNETPGWMETAKLFRAKWMRINSVGGWISALLQGMPIMYGRSGHAICSLLPKWRRGGWFFGYVNSWGRWGDVVNSRFPYGLGWDSERTISRCVGYACVNMTIRPEMNLAA